MLKNVDNLIKLFMQMQGVQKAVMFLRVDIFVMVSSRKACDMTKVVIICLEKNVELAYQCVQFCLRKY